MNIDDIYVRQWIKNDFLKKQFNKTKYNCYIVGYHLSCHIEDSINFNALITNNFDIYKKYIEDTYQNEHSINIYKNLLENFDINKMKKIEIKYNSLRKKYEVMDGVHRLCILIFKKIVKDRIIPLEYLNII